MTKLARVVATVSLTAALFVVLHGCRSNSSAPPMDSDGGPPLSEPRDKDVSVRR